MTKERLFRIIGQLDDKILERYHAIDQRLARKQANKKRALRVLAIAACAALLLGACIPVGMMIAQMGQGTPPDTPGISGQAPEETPDGGENAVPPEQESEDRAEQTQAETNMEAPTEQATHPEMDGTGAGTDPTPPEPQPSISLRGLTALKQMNEMLSCQDEQLLQEYLRSIEGGGANSLQDLVDFVALVQQTPCVPFLEGQLTWLFYQNGTSQDSDTPYEVFYATFEAVNGDWVRYEYVLSVQDVAEHLEQQKQTYAQTNLLSSPVQSADGRLTLHVETREAHSFRQGTTIIWCGEIDGRFIRIYYRLADGNTLDTQALLGSLEVSDLVDFSVFDKEPAHYSWENTQFGAFLETPEFHVYGSNYLAAPEFEGYEIDINIRSQEYVDGNAPATATVSYMGKDFVLHYSHSLTHGASFRGDTMLQATHYYTLQEGTYTCEAKMDQQTGECVYFRILDSALESGQELTPDQARKIAKEFLATVVDEWAQYYSAGSSASKDGYGFWFSRHVGSLNTCDQVYILVDYNTGRVKSYTLSFIGSMSNVQEIPVEMIETIKETLRSIAPNEQAMNGFYGDLDRLVITSDGRLALDCAVIVQFIDPDTQRSQQDNLLMLVYLTEPLK